MSATPRCTTSANRADTRRPPCLPRAGWPSSSIRGDFHPWHGAAELLWSRRGDRGGPNVRDRRLSEEHPGTSVALPVRASKEPSTCEKASLQIAGARCSYAQIVSTACPPARRRVWPRPGRRRSTVVAVRVVECAELIAADLFRNADENRHRITFGDVERHLAELANHPRGCSCGRCPLVSRVSAQRVYAIASGSGSRRACVFRTLVACRRPLRRRGRVRWTSTSRPAWRPRRCSSSTLRSTSWTVAEAPLRVRRRSFRSWSSFAQHSSTQVARLFTSSGSMRAKT